MVTRYALNNWINGNATSLNRSDLLQLIYYFETAADRSYEEARDMIDETVTGD